MSVPTDKQIFLLPESLEAGRREISLSASRIVRKEIRSEVCKREFDLSPLR